MAEEQVPEALKAKLGQLADAGEGFEIDVSSEQRDGRRWHTVAIGYPNGRNGKVEGMYPDQVVDLALKELKRYRADLEGAKLQQAQQEALQVTIRRIVREEVALASKIWPDPPEKP